MANNWPTLPIMQCDPNCGECCGPVFCNRDELDRVKQYAKQHGVEPLRQGITCPFYQGGTCAVHPARPFICKLFGHSPNLVCSRGYNRNVTADYETELMQQYERKGRSNFMLHELCYSEPEILGILEAEHNPEAERA